MPAAVTVITDVVSPVLHNNAPVEVVLKVELLQLSRTITTGADSNGGLAVPEPGKLVHPPTVLVTE